MDAYDKVTPLFPLLHIYFTLKKKQYLIPDVSDTGVEARLSKTTLAEGNTSVPELTKLQEKQRAAVARQKSRSANTGSNVYADLQDLSFDSDAARLPPPLRPTSPDSLEGNYGRRGSLSDFSSYESSGEETHGRRLARQVSPDKGKGRSPQGRYSDGYSSSSVVRNQPQPLLIDDSDPFADPV